jgi:hypothetical protein
MVRQWFVAASGGMNSMAASVQAEVGEVKLFGVAMGQNGVAAERTTVQALGVEETRHAFTVES